MFSEARHLKIKLLEKLVIKTFFFQCFLTTIYANNISKANHNLSFCLNDVQVRVHRVTPTINTTINNLIPLSIMDW